MIKPVKKKRRLQNPETRLMEALGSPAYWKKFEREMQQAAEELAAKRKDAILHLRINSRDLARLKEKAEAAGLGYQTFIAEILRRAAQS